MTRKRDKKSLENLWRTQHTRKKEWTKFYFDSWKRPLRYVIIKRLKDYNFENLLDLGCNSGPNLMALRKAGITAELFGIDINEEAISYGKERFKELGYDINLEVRSLYELDSKTTIDVIITTVVLQHIPHEGLSSVLDSIFRIAKKRVIIVDLHYFQPFLKSEIPDENEYRKYFDRFVRNWWSVLKPYVAQEKITISELPFGGSAKICDANAIIDIQL